VRVIGINRFLGGKDAYRNYGIDEGMVSGSMIANNRFKNTHTATNNAMSKGTDIHDFIECKLTGSKQRRELPMPYIGLAFKMISSIEDLLADAQKQVVEQGYVIEIEVDGMLHSYKMMPDLLLVDSDDVLTVVDWKTGKEPIKKVIAAHYRQASIYALPFFGKYEGVRYTIVYENSAWRGVVNKVDTMAWVENYFRNLPKNT
jgi:hypothetical protein